jgi:hypothetical protein
MFAVIFKINLTGPNLKLFYIFGNSSLNREELYLNMEID